MAAEGYGALIRPAEATHGQRSDGPSERSRVLQYAAGIAGIVGLVCVLSVGYWKAPSHPRQADDAACVQAWILCCGDCALAAAVQCDLAADTHAFVLTGLRRRRRLAAEGRLATCPVPAGSLIHNPAACAKGPQDRQPRWQDSESEAGVPAREHINAAGGGGHEQLCCGQQHRRLERQFHVRLPSGSSWPPVDDNIRVLAVRI